MEAIRSVAEIRPKYLIREFDSCLNIMDKVRSIIRAVTLSGSKV